MSMYLSIATGIEQVTAENSSARPDAPQVVEAVRLARWRLTGASMLRQLARVQIAAAARLERPSVGRLASA